MEDNQSKSNISYSPKRMAIVLLVSSIPIAYCFYANLLSESHYPYLLFFGLVNGFIWFLAEKIDEKWRYSAVSLMPGVTSMVVFRGHEDIWIGILAVCGAMGMTFWITIPLYALLLQLKKYKEGRDDR